MTVVDTKRITIGFLESQREQVVSTLKQLGTVHIDNMSSLLAAGEEGEPDPEELLEEQGRSPDIEAEKDLTERFRILEFPTVSKDYEDKITLLFKAVKGVSPYIVRKSFALELIEGIISSTFNIHPLISKKKYEETLEQKEQLLEKAREITDLVSRIREQDSRIRGVGDQLRGFKQFSSFDIPLELLRDTVKTRLRLGRMSGKAYRELAQSSWEEGVTPPLLITAKEAKKTLDVIVLYLKKDAVAIEPTLEGSGFRELIPPEGTGTPLEELEKLELQVQELKEEQVRMKEELAGYADHHLQFLALVDFYSNRKSEYDVGEHFLATDRTVFLTGWILTENMERTSSTLQEAVSSVDFQFRDPEEGERVPTKIRPAPWASSFGFITRMYGSPKWGDMDPTPFFAPFFVVFLGMCLSDAGYGIVLLALSIYASRTLRGGRNFFRVLIWGSVATIIVGALIGSWFGADLVADISGWPAPIVSLRDNLKFLQKVNITEGDGLLFFLSLSLVLGVIQVFTGILVKMYWNISQGRTKEALMDQGSWFIFLTGFLGWILASDMGGAVLSGTLAQVMNYLLYTGAILLVITQGRRQKNIVAKPFVGAIALYNVTGYFSDVLSYSRLLALGLATGLIALIVNLLAFMLYQGVADSIPIPIIGPLIAILVVSVFLVVAHLGNIALSLLGAIIHTLRLQYIEYFTKFYEGGGRTFTPFREVRGKVDIDHS